MDEVVAQERGERWRGRLIAGRGPYRDLRPLRLGRLAPEIAQAVDEAPLAERLREAGLDGADQARRAVRDDQERIGQPTPLEVLEEGRAARRVLLRVRRQVEQHLAPVLGEIPHAQSVIGNAKIPTCGN